MNYYADSIARKGYETMLLKLRKIIKTIKNKRMQKEWSVYIFFFLIYVIFFRDLFFSWKLIIVTDFPLLARDAKMHLIGFLYPWGPHNLGCSAFPGYAALLSALFVFISSGNQILSQKLYLLHILVACYMMYFFLRKHLTKSYFFSFIGALIYAYSPVTIDNFATGLLWGYALLPLLFYFLFNMFNLKSKKRDIILFSFVVVITSSWLPHILAVLPLIIFIFFFINILEEENKRNYLIIFFKRMIVALFFFFIFSFQSYAWFIFFSGGTEVSFVPSPIEVFYGNYETITILKFLRITGIGHELSHPIHLHYLENSYLGYLGYIIPFWSILSILITKDKKNMQKIIGFVILIIFMILFVNSVRGKWILFTYLYKVYAPLIVLRGPTILFHLMAFSCTYLMTASVDALYTRFNYSEIVIIHPEHMVSKYLIHIIVVLLIVVPYFLYCPTYDATIRKETPYFENPSSYENINNWLKKQDPDNNFRYLLTPLSHTARLNMQNDYPFYFYAAPGATNPRTLSYTTFFYDSLIEGENCLGSLLAPANVKYIVVVLNSTEPEHIKWYVEGPIRRYGSELGGDPQYFLDIFSKQKELELVVKEKDYVIFENKKFIPHISIYPANTYLIGDRNSLITLSHIPEFDIRNNLITFGEDISNHQMELFQLSSNVILNDRSYSDLILSFLVKNYGIELWQFGKGENSANSFDNVWLRSYTTNGYMEENIPGEGSLFTYGGYIKSPSSNTGCNFTFTCNSDDYYDIWLRILFTPQDYGTFRFYIDGEPAGHKLSTKSKKMGFHWIKISSLFLSEGIHNLSVDSAGFNILDELVIVPRQKYEEVETNILNSLENKNFAMIIDPTSDLVKYEGKEYKTFIKTSAANYSVEIITDQENPHQPLKLKIDGHNLSIESKEGIWRSESKFLDVGVHKVSVLTDIKPEKIIIFNNDTLRNVFRSTSFIKPHTKMISYSKYIVEYNSTGPSFIVLGESFHSDWRAYVDEKEALHFPAFSLTNGFFINETGNVKITIEHAQQGRHTLLVSLNALTIFFSLLLAVWETPLIVLGNLKIYKKLRKGIARTIKKRKL